MSKKIVICFDGTGNEYRASKNTNVVKLFCALKKDDPTTQIAFYDPGVGTISAPGAQTWIVKSMTKILGLVFGYGIFRNIADAYLYLMNQYEGPDNEIYLFGFSRGAYSARSLAGMLHFCGLLQKGSDNLVPYALKVYTQRKVKRPKWAYGWRSPAFYFLLPFLWLFKCTEPDWHRAGGFKRTFARECKPHFVGIWDTVKSVGWFRRRVVLPYTANHPHINFGRHAVSIDEKRSQYRPNPWGYKNKYPEGPKDKDIQQVWFVGVHSDVGGSYEESALSDIAFQWVLDGAKKHGLLIDQNELNRLGLSPDPLEKKHNPLVPLWWVLGWWRRTIPDGAWIHDSVRERMQKTKADEAIKTYEPTMPSRAVFVK